VVWNVVATPEFSVEPREWCFPIVGCVGYRGYFKEARAEEFAKPGDRLIVTAGVPFGTPGATNILRVAWVGD